MKLTQIMNENQENRPLSNEVKKHFLEIVSTYNKYQEMMDRKSDLATVAETLGGITEAARTLAIHEGDDWFDKHTIKRNMSELDKLGKEFDKCAKEATSLDQRLGGLYEDMGNILSRYYKIGEITEEQMKDRLGMNESVGCGCGGATESTCGCGTHTHESINEGKFKVDDLVYNKRTKTVGIVRIGDDKYGEVKTDADGNVDVDELEKYNPIKFKHQAKAKAAPSTEKEINKRGLFNPFKNESVNEVKYDTALTDFNKELENDSKVKKIASYYKKPTKMIVKALQPMITVLRYKDNSIKSISVNFTDAPSGPTTVKVSKSFNQNESVNEGISVFDERHFGKKGIIIMIDDNGKKVSAIFKDKKNADKYNRNNPSDIQALLKIAKTKPFGKAIDESVNEEKPGLWANIRAKQKRGEKPAHKNSQAHKDAVKAGKKINKEESVVSEAKFGYKDSTASYINNHKDEFKVAEKLNKGNEVKFYDALSQMEEKIGHPKFMIFLSNALRGYKVDMYKDPKIKNPQDAQEALFLLSK